MSKARLIVPALYKRRKEMLNVMRGSGCLLIFWDDGWRWRGLSCLACWSGFGSVCLVRVRFFGWSRSLLLGWFPAGRAGDDHRHHLAFHDGSTLDDGRSLKTSAILCNQFRPISG